jgi:Ca-activated chloride channel family protein
VIQPRDRGALVTFNDRPTLAVKFTNDLKVLAGGLAGLKAERGTALYDTVVFSLFYFNGVGGQRALVLLSDGKDESSRFTLDQTREYARRAGVAIYTIGLAIDARADRKVLSELAEETGGRVFFIDTATELAGVYETIQKELRSRYLLAYQSSNTTGSRAFRTIEVKVNGKDRVEAKTLRGYYP